ncbi:hypothetical protein [Longispora albida]|uniref:hypothetical protein n=1 Tax=Longispora albida TaxID=203523 RepID=UPI000364DC68|nr:hypothetical protein [Longispora albida]
MRIRCTWCGAELPSAAGMGRPRRYCAQACRQRAYEQRTVSARAGLPPEAVVVSRPELDHLLDRLFALRCALSDARVVLGEQASAAELRGVLEQVGSAAGELDRLWVTPRE